MDFQATQSMRELRKVTQSCQTALNPLGLVSVHLVMMLNTLQNGQYLGLIFGVFLGAKPLKTTVFEMHLQCDVYSGYHMPSIFALQ